MWTAILSLIPGFTNLLNSWITHTQDVKLKMYTARLGGDTQGARALLNAEVANNQTKVSWLQAISGSPVLTFVVVGFAFPFIFYLNKVIIYDMCLGLGTTPTLKYELLSEWGSTIIGGIFITSGGVAAVQTWVNRK